VGVEQEGPGRLPLIGRAIGAGRYVVLFPALAGVIASLALMIYETLIILAGVVRIVLGGRVSQDEVKILAVGLIQAMDILLIAIAMYMISVGLYALFVDHRVRLPKWLEVHDFDDLKGNLISVVIAVLAVLFLREAVAWDGTRDLLVLGISIGLVVAALTFYLGKARPPDQ